VVVSRKPKVTLIGNLFDRLAETCTPRPAPEVRIAWYWGDSLRCRSCFVCSENAGQLAKCPACGFESILCQLCSKPIAPGEWVELNGRTLHVDPCFSDALKLLPDPKDFALKLADAMPPLVAYRAGQQHIGVILSARRRAKKRT
jgi:hypothetical protein